MQVTLGFSPCPNDTFIFYALLHQKIPLRGISFKWVMEDVETLNAMALRNTLHITKLSYHALAYVLHTYRILNSGSALGKGVGPLLIARRPLSDEEIGRGSVVIPGNYTTAHFLLTYAYPTLRHKVFQEFSTIEQAVAEGTFDMGVIIHENRFTYQQKGLVLLKDLGTHWEQRTGYPIPLGGIAVQRGLPAHIQQAVDAAIGESLRYAYAHPEETLQWVRQYAQSMDEAVMLQHINLYVNDYTLQLGAEGKAAVQHFLSHLPITKNQDTHDLFV